MVDTPPAVREREAPYSGSSRLKKAEEGFKKFEKNWSSDPITDSSDQVLKT